MSWSSLYIQILISLAIALGALILTITDILPLRVLIGLVPILVLLAILRNSIDKRTNKKSQLLTDELSLEIDHNLKLLCDFWEKFKGLLSEHLSLSEAIRKTTRVVISQSPMETAEIGSIESEIDLPIWHRKVFGMPTPLVGISNRKKQEVNQFYDNLETIASIYEKIKRFGYKVVRRTNLEEQLESLVTEVLKQGNPLKNT